MQTHGQRHFLLNVFLYSMVMLALALPATGCRIKKAQRTTPDLITFTACSELETRLKNNLRQEMRASLLSYNDLKIYTPIYDGGSPVPTAGADSAFNGTEGSQEGVDYSGTNNQEPGADEADFVKTDGESLFIINNNKFIALHIPQPGLIDNGTTTALEGYPSELLIYKNPSNGKAGKAVVFSNIYSFAIDSTHPLYSYIAADNASTSTSQYPVYRSYMITKITVIDLESAQAPSVIKEFYVEGSYQTARLINNSAHMVFYSWLDVPGLSYWPELPDTYYTANSEAVRKIIWNMAVQKTLAENDRVIDSLSLGDLVPRYYELSGGAIVAHDPAAGSCGNFSIADDGSSRGFTTILSLNLLSDMLNIDDDYIVSNLSTVYASSDTMIIAEPSNDLWWYRDNTNFEEATNLHKFALDNGTAHYTGSGRISGSIKDQFSLSEYEGALRVAATTNSWTRWWEANPAAPENHIYILTEADNGSLRTTGHFGGIGTGERIWAARFIGAKGYLTTFRNIDPLWTIDLSNVSNPEIIGTIDVPGVSTYIHPLADDRLLTIGYGGDESGLDWSIQVSLFDVSDFAHPLIIDNMTLAINQSDNSSYSWSSSEAAYEHKAFQYWEPKKMLAVPLSAWKSTWDNTGNGTYTYSSTLVLLNVDKDTGFSMHGTIDHSPYYNSENQWYWFNQDIRRSIFMDDYIYAISDRAVTVHQIDNMTLTGTISLPGTIYEYEPYIRGVD